MASEDLLLVDDAGAHVRVLTLNRPSRLNALNSAAVHALLAALDVAEADDTRVVVLTGAGRGFCAGWDVKEAGAVLSGDTVTGGVDMQRQTASLIRRLRTSTVPIVAAVNGPAVGGGFSLALACDMRVLARSATLSPMFIRLGISGADLGTSWLLPRAIGTARAMELMLTGRDVDAVEADRIGLVNRVVDDIDVVSSSVELAESIARMAPLAVTLTKETAWSSIEIPSLHAAMELENRTQVLATQSEDHKEALAAWREGRAPVFGDR